MPTETAQTEIANPYQRRNQNIYLISTLLQTIGGGLCAQGYIQSYLLQSGMSASNIGLYGSLSQIFSVCAYLLFTWHKPKGGYLRGYLTGRIVYSVYPLFLLSAGAFAGNIPMMLGAVCIAAGICGFANASAFACQNCMIPLLFSRKNFGILQGRSGLIGGILTTIISLAAGAVLGNGDVRIGYICFFAGGAALFLISALSASFYRLAPMPENVRREAAAKVSLRAVFNRPFLFLMLPHFLRGIGAAGLYYFVYLSLQNISLSAMENSMLVTFSVAANVLSCLIFMRAIRMGIKTGKLVQYSMYICSAMLMLTIFNHNNILFFVLYFVEQIAINIVGHLVPVGVMRSTRTEDLPLVTPVRMMMINFANSFFTFLYGNLFAFLPAAGLMLFSAVAYCCSGILFRRQFTDWAG